MVLLQGRSTEHFEAFRSILKHIRMERNTRRHRLVAAARYILLPIDANCWVRVNRRSYPQLGKDIERRLKAFVANLQAPLGQIPFERAVMRHLPFLLDLRRRGLTWTSIVGILRARAMRRAEGRLISDDQLRGVVSWQDRRSKTKVDAAGRRSHS